MTATIAGSAAVAVILLFTFSVRAWNRGWYAASGGGLFAAALLGMWAVTSPETLAAFYTTWIGVWPS